MDVPIGGIIQQVYSFSVKPFDASAKHVIGADVEGQRYRLLQLKDRSAEFHDFRRSTINISAADISSGHLLTGLFLKRIYVRVLRKKVIDKKRHVEAQVS